MCIDFQTIDGVLLLGFEGTQQEWTVDPARVFDSCWAAANWVLGKKFGTVKDQVVLDPLGGMIPRAACSNEKIAEYAKKFREALDL
jgi:hypothetical protein